jgi:transposase
VQLGNIFPLDFSVFIAYILDVSISYSPIEIPSNILSNPEQLPDFTIQLGEQFNTLLVAHEKLSHELSWLKRQVFGQKSERFIPNEQQLGLGLDAQETSAPITTETIQYKRNRPSKKQEGHGRGVMPTHLPIEDVVIEPEEDVTGLECIGEETSWEYEYEPGCLKVKRYRRPKYVRRGELSDDILIGALPPRPIEKGNAGPGLMARVAVDKFVYHTPLDRQRRKFKMEDGVDIAESTLCDIVRHTAFWIEPLYRLHAQDILSISYLQADETPMPVLIKGKKGRTHTGYFWVYYDPLRNLVLFDYRQSRSRDGPSEILKDFRGILQIDGYAGYNQALTKDGMVRAACMAHVRRKFKDALETDRHRTEYALKAMKKWFRRESMAQKVEMGHDRRMSMRRNHIVPFMNSFHGWLKKEYAQVLPQSPIGKAITYALNQWPGFTPFMSDGRVELSNNLVENAIRPITLGRKNYLFKGSHEAAKRAAMIYSMLSTAMRHGQDPFAYFKDILTRLPAAKTAELANFLPQKWKAPAQPGPVKT